MSFLKKQSETLGQIHRLHVLTSVYMFEIIDIEHYKDEQPFYRS